MIKRKFFLIICIVGICVCLCGCEKYSQEELVEQKIIAQTLYLDENLNNITTNYFTGKYFLDDNQIKWNELSDDFKKIEDSISIIIIDLASRQIDKNDILVTEKYILECSNAIYEKDIYTFLSRICDLYAMLPRYLFNCSQDKNLADLLQIKSSLLYSQYFALLDDYDSANININKAEEQYNELIKNKDFMDENSYKINKVYLEIQEIKIAIQNQNINEIIRRYVESTELF